MLANDIKKGMRLRLRNGWYGTMMDNAKGNTRMVDVEGFEREIGSVYTKDIALVYIPDATWSGGLRPEPVELSDRQRKAAAQISALFG
jgi:hypothetical protein